MAKRTRPPARKSKTNAPSTKPRRSNARQTKNAVEAPPRDVPAGPKHGSEVERPQPDGASGESGSDLVDRLRRAVLNELTVVESLRDRLKNEPQSRVAAERTARTLSTLTDTLQKLQRLQCAVPANGPDYDMPADIDEFRRNLARRIDEMVASRPDDGARERSVAADSDDPARR